MLRILQFSDTHLFADPAQCCYGINPDLSLQKILEFSQGRETSARLAIVTGDLVHDGSAAAYERFQHYFSLMEMPVYCLPGNHDERQVMRAHLGGGRVQQQSLVVCDGWLLILLDSTVAGAVGGHLDQAALDFVDRTLARYPLYHVLIALHHPPRPCGCDWLDQGLLLDNPEDLFALMHAHGTVRCLLWGHIHQVYEQDDAGIRLLGTPSTMAQFKPASQAFAIDHSTPAYRWLNLHDDGSLDSGIVRLPDGDIPACR